MASRLTRVLPRARSVPSPCVGVHSSRAMHASAPLDPTQHQPEASLNNVVQDSLASSHAESSEIGSSSSAKPSFNDAFVHVKLAYLHPSTKDPIKVPHPIDIKCGRQKAEPQYVPLSSYVFGIEPRRDVLHSAVVYYLDGLRAGTASTKSRGEVAFSGRRLSPRKGTCRARRGSRGSPLLRKGGVAHGPKPRDFSTKLNRRVRELALRSALSLRWRSGDLHVVKNFFWQRPPHSTRPLALLLKTKGWDDALLLTAPRNPQPGVGMGRTKKPSAVDPVYEVESIVQHAKDVQDLAIACANIQRIEMIKLNDLTPELHEQAEKVEDKKRPGELHAYEVLSRKKLICDIGAIEWLEEKLGGSLFHEAIGLGALSLEETLASSGDSEEVMTDDQEIGALKLGVEPSAIESTAPEVDERSEEEKLEDEDIRVAEDEAIAQEVERVLDGVEGERLPEADERKT